MFVDPAGSAPQPEGVFTLMSNFPGSAESTSGGNQVVMPCTAIAVSARFDTEGAVFMLVTIVIASTDTIVEVITIAISNSGNVKPLSRSVRRMLEPLT